MTTGLNRKRNVLIRICNDHGIMIPIKFANFVLVLIKKLTHIYRGGFWG